MAFFNKVAERHLLHHTILEVSIGRHSRRKTSPSSTTMSSLSASSCYHVRQFSTCISFPYLRTPIFRLLADLLLYVVKCDFNLKFRNKSPRPLQPFGEIVRPLHQNTRMQQRICQLFSKSRSQKLRMVHRRRGHLSIKSMLSVSV